MLRRPGHFAPTTVLAVLLGTFTPAAFASPARAATTQTVRAAASGPLTAPDQLAALEEAAQTGQKVEVLDAETATSTTYANPDQTLSIAYTATPARVKQSDGSYAPLNMALQQQADGSWTPTTSPNAMSFGGATSDHYLSIPIDGTTVTLDAGAPLSDPTVAGNTAIYAISGSEQFTLTALSWGADAKVVLTQPPTTPLVIQLPFSAGTLTPVPQVDGSILLQDGTRTIATIPPPLMSDSTPDGEASQPLHQVNVPMTLVGNNLVLSPPTTFLTDPAVQYPVTIDPSVNMNRAGDIHINQTGSTGDGGSTKVVVGLSPGGNVYRVFENFQAPAIPAGSHLVSADYSDYEYGSMDCNPHPMDIFEIRGAWSESTLTWTNQPLTDTLHVASNSFAFGDEDELPNGEFDCPEGIAHVDVTGPVSDYMNGTYPWDGLELRAANETDGMQYKSFCSQNWQSTNPADDPCRDSLKAPILNITYNTPPATPTNLNPPNGTTNTSLTPTLSGSMFDADGGALTAKFFVKTHGATTWNLVNAAQVSTSSGSTASYTVPSGLLSPGQTYDWGMTAYDGVDASAPTAIISFTTANPPPAPTVTGPGCTNSTSPTVTWNPPFDPTGIAGYSYVLDQTTGTDPGFANQGSTTSAQFSGKSEGSWHFHIRSLNGAGEWGNPLNPDYIFTIDTTAPSTPANLSSPNHPDSTPSSNNTFTVNWSPATDNGCGVAGYRYTFDQLSTRPDATPITSDQFTTGTTATTSNLADGSWYLHVRTVDVAGNVSPYTTFGPAVVHRTALVLSKVINTVPADGVYGRGEYLQYTVTLTNTSSTPTTVTSIADTVTAGQQFAGTPTLTPPGGSPVNCLTTTTTALQCAINSASSQLSGGPNFSASLGGGQALTLTYTTLATGIENGCKASQNTLSTVDTAGTASVPPVTITICDNGLGVEPWWSYVTKPVAAQSQAMVNVMNGNLVVQATDSTPVPARGRLAYVIRRSYNSQDSTAVALPGSLGAGWQLNIGQTDDLAGLGVTTSGLSVPSASSLAAPTGVTLIDRDGTRHLFTYRSASISTNNPLDVSTIAGGSALAALVPQDPLLEPTTISGGQNPFLYVCVDAMYQAPPGVHLSLWRYVGTNGNGCTATQTDSTARIIGFAAIRPDRLRYEFDAAGHLLDMTDGSGVSLRYAYDTVTPSKLRSVDEPRSCAGAAGGTGCRAIVFSYSDDSTNACPVPSGASSSECVTDPAGRRTLYAFDNQTPKHLIEVDNPPDNPSGTRDRVLYAYQGFGAGCGATLGQLCSVTDARGNTSRFAYTAQPVGLAAVTGITDRRGTTTTLTYTGSPATSTTADTAGERTSYLSIDTSGRVGEIDQGPTSGSPVEKARYTWDTASSSCTYTSGTVQGTHTTWNRQDNNLCQLTRLHVTGTTDETTKTTYTPEGMTLSTDQVMPGGSDLFHTYAYATQYARNGTATTTATDTVTGNGDVAIDDRSAAIGDGANVPGDPSVVYALSDLSQSLTPNGNAPGATAANFETDYTVGDNPAAQPDINPNSASCVDRNSGSICSVSSPFDGSAKAVITNTFDDFGQKLTTTTGNGGTYTYSYYPAGSTDAASHATDSEGWLEAVTDPAGNFVFFAEDAAGNTIRTWDRNATQGHTINELAADNASNQPVAGFDQTLYASSLTGSPWRYQLSHTDPLGNTTSTTVDANGDAVATSDARTNTTRRTVDADGNTLTVTTPAEPNNPTTDSYDAFGNLTKTVAPNGGITVNVYDTLNRRTTGYADRGSAASGTPNPGGGCVTTDTGANAITGYPTGEVVCATKFTYDDFDNVTSSTDGTGATTSYTYDAANRQLTVVKPRTGSTTFTTQTLYDLDGNPIDTCPPLQTSTGTCSDSSPGIYTTHRTYSEADRLVTVTTYRALPASPHGDPVNSPTTSTDITSYTYDHDGNQLTTTDPNGNVTQDSYDQLDRKISETRHHTQTAVETTTYQYDPVGNLTATLAPGTQPADPGTGTDLVVDGSQYPESSPLQMASGVTYHNITLQNNGWITAAGTGSAALTITATGTITINSGSGITVDGRGAAGGASTNGETQPTNTGNTGSGSGGGHGGANAPAIGGGGGGASYGTDGTSGGAANAAGAGAGGTSGNPYGNSDFPDGGSTADVGSGGGGGGSTPLERGGSGGRGGGFLHLIASTIENDGVITASGLSGNQGGTDAAQHAGSGGGGSGGGIWLTASSITGGGSDLTCGGASKSGTGGTGNNGGAGGYGRIRVDADFLAVSFTCGYPTRHTLGRITAYSYDADNRLIDTITGASNATASADGTPSSDGGSNIRTRLVYDPDGNIVGRYDPRAFATSVTSPNHGYETAYLYDADNRLTDTYLPYTNGSVTDPINGAPSQCGDATSTSVTDYQSASGVKVCHLHYGYDHDGNRTLVQLPTYDSNHTTRVYTYGYTADDLLSSVTIPNPSTTTGATGIVEDAYSYDGDGRQLTDQRVPASNGPVTTTSYTLDGLVAQITPPAGDTTHQTTYSYDPNGNRTSETDQQDPTTQRTSYTDYYSDNTVYTQVDPAGNTTSYTYDANGNTTAVYSPSANTSDATDKTNPNHLPTTYTYFADSLPRTTTTPHNADGSQNRITTYGYDVGGDKTSVTAAYSSGSSATNVQSFTYYPDALLASASGGSGQSQAFQYDAAGHPTNSSDTSSNGTVTTTASYYLNDAPRQITEKGSGFAPTDPFPQSTTTYSYDAADSVIARQETTGNPAATTTTSYTYTDAEQPTTTTSDSTAIGTITTGYDNQGRPVATTYGGSGARANESWNPDDTLHSINVVDSNQTSNTTYTYDGLTRITAADTTSGTPSVDCTQTTLPAGLQCFSYDAAGHVQTFTDSQANRTAAYDADGNRTSYGQTGNTAAPLVTATYNPDDSIHDQQIGTGADNTFTYDQPFGGVTNDGCNTYIYDGFERLTSVVGIGASGCQSSVTYIYDALDRQAQRSQTATGGLTSTTTTLAYDGQDPALTAEVPSAGTTNYTLSAAGQPVALSTATTTQYLTDDGHGNIASVTTASNGNLACAFRYDPWGNELTTGQTVSPACTASNTPDNLQYSSAYKDGATGDYSLGSRIYDPTKAGFLSPDSFRKAPSSADLSVGTDPLTRNTYDYVNGDPVNQTDPDGHRPICDNGECPKQVLATWLRQSTRAEASPAHQRWVKLVNLEGQLYEKLVQEPQNALARGAYIDPDAFRYGGAELTELIGGLHLQGTALGLAMMQRDVEIKSQAAIAMAKTFVMVQSIIGEAAGALSLGTAAVASSLARSALEDALTTEAENSLVNLASPARTNHILYGDATGGGHLWPGLAGKTPFPANWSADDVMNAISEVATRPGAQWVPQGSKFVITGSYRGVDIRIIYDTTTDDFTTAFPTNLPRNAK